MNAKRILSCILLVALLAGLFPVFPEVVHAAQEELHTVVHRQVTAYADSIAQEHAQNTAATALLTNAAFRAKDLSFDENNAMTAMIVNSGLFQDAITNSLINSVEFLRQQNMDSVYCVGGAEWRVYSASYSMSARSGRDITDRSNWLGTIAVSSTVHPDMESLLNMYNENDRMLVMLVGGMRLEYTITRQTVKENAVVYHVALTCSDGFDFNGEYDESDYNRDFEQLLTAFGQLSLKPFRWECSISFQVEVPYSCGHSAGSYRWIHNSDGTGLVCDTTEGFCYNPPEPQPVIRDNGSGGTTTTYFYKLSDPVFLDNESPWVLEYDMKGWTYFLMTPFQSAASALPLIFHYGKNYPAVCQYERVFLEDEEQEYLGIEEESTYLRHLFGPKVTDMVELVSGHTYCYRMENVPAEDGSNMVYLSIYDYDLGELILGPEPMDDRYSQYMKDMGQEWTLQSTEDPWLSGKDIILNYIGGAGITLNNSVKAIRIYENSGESGESDAFRTQWVEATCTEEGYLAHTCTKCGYMYRTDLTEKLEHDYAEKVIAPTCTAEGYTSYTCRDCGHSYHMDIVGKLPHSVGAYTYNNDATCAHDGTKTGKCTVCGEKVTVADEGTALPHTWTDATCEKAKTCKFCGATQGDPLGHDLKHYNAKAPTCENVGWDAYEKCLRCTYSTFARLPALGHDYVNGVCTRCGDWDGTVTPGDTSGDGRVDTVDTYQIILYLNGALELTDTQLLAADVNGDGRVDLTDVYRILLIYKENG